VMIYTGFLFCRDEFRLQKEEASSRVIFIVEGRATNERKQ
jgi:hypothetical protein